MRTPQVTRTKEPYAPETCWYGLKVGENTTIPCGIDARLYDVFRDDSKKYSHGITPSQCMQVWLCVNHVQSMETDGFIVRLSKNY